MMSSQDRQTYDDRLLTRYLLGALPVDEAERMDELCVADDELATRLHAIENDLVDAYVRGEVSGEDLERFESFYLSSAKRRQKVEFAAALQQLERKAAAAPVPVTPQAAVPAPKPKEELAPALPVPVRRPIFRWGFAFAAAMMLLAAGYLLLDNLHMRRQIGEARSQHEAMDRRDQELQKELNDQRSANAESRKEIERLRQSQTKLEELKTVSLLLPPPTRGAARVSTVSVPAGTGLAVLVLTLEPDDFPAYRASLKDPAANQILWSSANLQSASLGKTQAVFISFPASLLKQQNYIVELTGQPARGAPESIGSYPFRVVVK